jgi:hypothetical protein
MKIGIRQVRDTEASDRVEGGSIVEPNKARSMLWTHPFLMRRCERDVVPPRDYPCCSIRNWEVPLWQPCCQSLFIPLPLEVMV